MKPQSSSRWLLACSGALLAAALSACAPQPTVVPPQPADAATAKPASDKSPDPVLPHHFTPEEVTTTGSVTVGGQPIAYHAVTGTLVVHPKGWDDVSQRIDIEPEKPKGEEGKPAPKMTKAEASMFYVAYFKDGAPAASRPVTFLYNGGPGSATVWLHMGAFGPKRVVTAGDQHLPAAPYPVVSNEWSLLDATDVVFIDAPGAGFSRIAGPDKEKSFYGVDGDAHAFAEFITQFLGKYGRWNSPKYLFGESYGTTRSAVLVAELELRRAIDVNGVIMLSQFLDAGLDENSPGLDLQYELALPTFAATAWYHHRLGPGVPADLKALVAEVERFALTEYARALQQGNALPEAERAAIAAKLHAYTSLPVAYLRKANLRVTKEMFEKALQDEADVTTGRLDSRFSSPAMDPLAKEPDYDPFSAAVGSAYVSAFNDYVRKELKFGEGRSFQLFADTRHWVWEHHGFGGHAWTGGLNVLGDLAAAMKHNPNLHVQLEAGLYDLATPFFTGTYELNHLPIPDKLVPNLETRRYAAGHMIYAVEAELHALHDNVADFIRRTATPAAK
jgi:carboxypeptidase C (cathepsin A)